MASEEFPNMNILTSYPPFFYVNRELDDRFRTLVNNGWWN